MRIARSFFLSVVCVALAVPILAEDGKDTAEALSAQQISQPSSKDFSTELVPTPFGMGSFTVKLLEPAQPAVARKVTVPNDRACLKLRMYKVKRTERLAEGETAERGYTTCELASNYQMRSAVAHAHGTEDSSADGRK